MVIASNGKWWAKKYKNAQNLRSLFMQGDVTKWSRGRFSTLNLVSGIPIDSSVYIDVCAHNICNTSKMHCKIEKKEQKLYVCHVLWNADWIQKHIK